MSKSTKQFPQLGETIRNHRLRKFWSQETLAQKAGIKNQTLREIELNKRTPRYQTILKIAQALNLNPEEFSQTQTKQQQNKTDTLTHEKEATLGTTPEQFNELDDLTFIAHCKDMLKLFMRMQNLIGPNSFHQIVCNELKIINHRQQYANSHLQLELQLLESQWSEFASWSAVNVGKHFESQQWLNRALVLAQRANNDQLISYNLSRQAQQTTDYGDANKTIALAQQALSLQSYNYRDMALCKVREAQGLALCGDSSFIKSINMASKLVEQADNSGINDDPNTYGHHCTHAYVLSHFGFCYLQIDNRKEAIRIFLEILPTWPNNYKYDEALTRAWLALAYALEGELEAAAQYGTQVLAVPKDSVSARALQILASLNNILRRKKPTSSTITGFQLIYSANIK